MPQEILVPMDESPPSKAALDHACSEYSDAEITVLHVIDTPEAVVYGEMMTVAEVHENAQERAAQLLSDAQEIATDYGIDLTTVTEQGSPARTITAYAGENEVDHIIMGSHGREGITRLLLGSVAEQVVRRAPVPVTVVR